MVLKVKKEARSSGESSARDESSDSDDEANPSRLKSSVAVRKRSPSSSRSSRSRSSSPDRFGRIKRKNPSPDPPPRQKRRPSPDPPRQQRRQQRRSRSRSRSRSPVRRRRRSPSRSKSPANDRRSKPNLDSWRREGEVRQNPRYPSTHDPQKAQESEYWQHRRFERSKICQEGRPKMWGQSPDRREIERIYTRADYAVKPEILSDSDADKKKKKSKKQKKDKKEKKKSKKSKKRRKKASSDEGASDSSDAEQWVEVTKELIEQQQTSKKEEEANIIGPQLPPALNQPEEAINPAIYGKDMLKGEAAAMAAYIAQGKRIPRRGEIGLSSTEISVFENVGYVMSGTRHKAMEATRLRKENQVYSAEEKRMLSGFSQGERKNKEAVILSQFRELVNKKMNKE